MCRLSPSVFECEYNSKKRNYPKIISKQASLNQTHSTIKNFLETFENVLWKCTHQNVGIANKNFQKFFMFKIKNAFHGYRSYFIQQLLN